MDNEKVNGAAVVNGLPGFNYFQVESKKMGIQESFTNEDAAKRSYGRLRTRFMRDKTEFDLKLNGKVNLQDEWQEISSLKVKEKHFEEAE